VSAQAASAKLSFPNEAKRHLGPQARWYLHQNCAAAFGALLGSRQRGQEAMEYRRGLMAGKAESNSGSGGREVQKSHMTSAADRFSRLQYSYKSFFASRARDENA